MFAQLLEEVVQSETAHTNSITDGQLTVTYAELPSILAAIGDYLAEQGIKSTDHIALTCPNTLPNALTIFALMEQGISFFLLPHVEESQADLKPVPQFCQYRVMIDEVAPDANADWTQFPERFLTVERNPHFQPLPEGTEHGERQIYLRTSGSMGTAKIVVHSHDNFVGNAVSCVEKYALDPSDRVVVPIPLAHIYGLAGAFLPAFAAGASIDLQSNTNHLQYFAREKAFKPNVAFLTPTICDLLLPGFSSPRSYKVVITSAQRITDDLFRRFDAQIGGTLINMYGSSELGTVAGCDPHDPLEAKIATIGKPLQTAQLRIQQPDPTTGIGALQCQNKVSFVGYVDEAGTWLLHNAQDEWFETGDLAKVVEAGNIQLVGRAKNSTNRSGYLVMFSDIERIMEGFEDLAQVIVVASGEETERGQALVAFCIPQPGIALNSQQVRRRCFDQMPTYAIPDEVRMMASLPLLPSGKVDQQALQKQAQTLYRTEQHGPASSFSVTEIASQADATEALIHLIANELDVQIPAAEIRPEMALLNEGLRLDSIALVKLTTQIKTAFELDFRDDALDIDALQSVRTLSKWIYGQIEQQNGIEQNGNQTHHRSTNGSRANGSHANGSHASDSPIKNLRANVSLLHFRATTFGISYYDLLAANEASSTPETWSAALVPFAERYEDAARQASATGQRQSARHWWQMTVNYYHFAQMFQDGEARQLCRTKCWEAYAKLAALVEPQCKRIEIPYQDMLLPGYLRIAHPGAPCIIMLGGFEFAKEAELHQWGEYFLARGISVLCFDGPGQGEVAAQSHMRGDFETVIAAAIDFLNSEIAEVDTSRIGLFGVSLGGHMAMRAAAMEERVAACITLSGPFDGSTTLNLAPRNQLVTARLFGLDTVDQLLDPNGPINLATLPRAMTQPLFIIHSHADHVVPTPQVDLIEEWAQGETELLLLDDVEHCCFSREREVMPKAADWLAQQLGVEQRDQVDSVKIRAI